MSIAMAGSHPVQSHRVCCPPNACFHEGQANSPEVSMITLVSQAFQPSRRQAPPPRQLPNIRDNSTFGDGTRSSGVSASAVHTGSIFYESANFVSQ
jgi:hypothetical protein